MSIIIAKVIPIFVLIGLGYVANRTKWLKDGTIDDLKKMMLNVILPAVLFLSFVIIKFKMAYFTITLIVFLLCGVLYYIGVLLNKIKFLSNPIIPFVMTGFTFGLLGIPIYSSIFGIDNLEKMSILGVGHELFMWFVYYTILKIKFSGEKFSTGVIKNFIKSPIILSIILGIILNLLGLAKILENNVILNGFRLTIEYLSNISIPLILFIIGHGINFNKSYMKESIKLILVRLIVIFSVGMLVKWMIIDKIIINDKYFDYAYFTLLLLPPPYSLPIFIGEYSTQKNKELVNNTVVLHTVIFILIYVLFVFFRTG